MISANGTTVTPISMAMRQPQSLSACSGSRLASVSPTSPDNSVATYWVACCSETYRPRFCAGAASSMKAVVGPTSPPSAKPCNSRKRTARIGAAMPIRA